MLGKKNAFVSSQLGFRPKTIYSSNEFRLKIFYEIKFRFKIEDIHNLATTNCNQFLVDYYPYLALLIFISHWSCFLYIFMEMSDGDVEQLNFIDKSVCIFLIVINHINSIMLTTSRINYSNCSDSHTSQALSQVQYFERVLRIMIVIKINFN